MALTRNFLKSMGLTDEQVNAIIENHTDTVEALKKERDSYKTDAEKLPTVQKELDDLKAGDGNYKEKYEAEAKAHKEYKQQVEAEKTAARDDADVLALCKEAGIARDSSLRLIAKDFDRSKIKRGEDGKITNHDELVSSIKTDYADFVGTPGNQGTPPTTPPSGGRATTSKTKEEIYAIKDPAQRQAEMAKNLSLFGIE